MSKKAFGTLRLCAVTWRRTHEQVGIWPMLGQQENIAWHDDDTSASGCDQGKVVSIRMRSSVVCVPMRTDTQPVIAITAFALRAHGRNGGKDDMEGVAESEVSKLVAARASLSVMESTSFGLCRSPPG